MPSIDIDLNARAAERNLRTLAAAFDDIADAADDAMRDTERSGDRMERALLDVEDDAKRADKAVESIGDGSRRGMGKASESVAEFKSEAIQNLSEVTSSFNGDMASVGDLVQGTFGGLASSLPGILGVAGAGVAVAVGGIIAGLQSAEEERKLLEERAADLASAYVAAGTTVLDALTVADRTTSILTDPTRREEAEALAKTLGGDLSLAVRLLAGDSAALAEAQTMQAAAEERNAQLADQTLAASSKRKSANEDERLANEALIGAGQKQTDIQSKAANTAQAQSDIYRDLIDSAEGVTRQVDELGNELYTLPGDKKIVIDANTGQASTNIDIFKGNVESIPREVGVAVRTYFDQAAMDRTLAAIRDRAARGAVTVAVNTRGGRELF